MEAIESGRTAAAEAVSRLVEVLQPVNLRADRLGSTDLFYGLSWPELEFLARFFRETLIDRGTRLTVQGKPAPRLWLILEGEALVSADVRPLRVAARGDVIGLTSMLDRTNSPESAIAIAPIRAFEVDPEGFAQVALRSAVRRRLVLAEAALSSWSKRSETGRPRSG